MIARRTIPQIALVLFLGAIAQSATAGDAWQEFRERATAQNERLKNSRQLEQTFTAYGDVNDYQVWLSNDRFEKAVTSLSSPERRVENDYFLDNGKVHAWRIYRETRSLDGKTKHVDENFFAFGASKPIRHVVKSGRFPAATDSPDLSKLPERVIPIVPQLDGLADELTARAFELARKFRGGIDEFAEVRWDFFLKDAPPSPPDERWNTRPKGWLPPPSATFLPIENATSPDGCYAVAWGFPRGPIDWKSYSDQPSFGGVIFSSLLPQSPPKADDSNPESNLLVDRRAGRVLASLATTHPGERERFNHQHYRVEWSPAAACVVAVQDSKWDTEAAVVAWIANGECAGSYDILTPLVKAADAAVIRAKHPAAKHLRNRTGDDANSGHRIDTRFVGDDGLIECTVTWEVPKGDLDDESFSALVEGRLSPGPKGGAAKFEPKTVRVLPVRER